MREALHASGFALWPHRLDELALAELAALFGSLAHDRPGARIDPAGCRHLGALAAIAPQVRDLLGAAARPVRALLFDKRDGANWALGWHQDRTIEVAERVEVPGYGPWTVKQGRSHVAPPIALLEGMLTVRIHLDAVPEGNAPLLVAPGTHRLGLIAEDAIERLVRRHGTAVCLAEAGSVWFYATPILHASARSTAGGHRRVLQLDYAPVDLPGGLRWAADGPTTVLEGAATLA